MVARRMRLNKRSGNKSLVTSRGTFTLTGNAATLTKSGGTSYPAVVTTLGIEHVYDLQTSGTGCQIADGSLLTPSQSALDSAYGVGNVTFDNTNKRVRLGGTYSGTRKTFEGWDLTGIEFWLDPIQKGWTVKNCKFGPSRGPSNTLVSTNYPINISNANASAISGDANSNVIIEYCTIDGYHAATDTYHGSGGLGAGIAAPIHGWTVRNCTFRRMAGDNIQGRGNNVLIEKNYMTVGGFGTGAHHDMLQFFQGDSSIYRENFLDMTPVLGSKPSNGRTNACRLESWPSGSITNFLCEKNYVKGGLVLDINGAPLYYPFSMTVDPVNTGDASLNNRFNNNATDYGLAVIYPSSVHTSGTGNRKLDNTTIADFSL